MKIHLLENFDDRHKPCSVGEEILVGGTRIMKITVIEKVNETTNRLTLED